MTFVAVSWQYRDPILWSKLEQMRNNVLDHDHRSDGTQGSPRGKWATGSHTFNHGAGGTLTQAVSFPVGRFTVAPNVVVLQQSPVAAHDGNGAHTVTATGFTLWSSRSNAGSSIVTWVAREAF
jgi:hypothetical protein